MNGTSKVPIDPKIREALTNAREARALFKAVSLAHDVDGDMPEVLSVMLAERLQLIQQKLADLLPFDDVPF